MELSKELYDSISEYMKVCNVNSSYELECKFNHEIDKSIFTKVLNVLHNHNDYKYVTSLHRDSLDINITSTNTRVTFTSKEDINNYCKYNIIPSNVDIMNKIIVKNYPKINVNAYKLVFKINNELVIDETESILSSLSEQDKFFRRKQRHSFIHESNAFRIDLTIVKSSKNKSKTYLNSNITKNIEKYEIEIEYLNDIKESTFDNFWKIIENVLQIIDDTHFVISEKEKTLVLCDYIKLVNDKMFDKCSDTIFDYLNNTVLHKPKQYFLSYQPITLEQQNIIEPELGIDSIHKEYTVTEKADGERYLLYVHKNNKVYALDNRLHVKYLGISHKNSNSIIDCEFIKKSKFNTFINTFMCFDIYFMNNKDCRNKPLISERLDLLKAFCNISSNNAKYKIECKKFEHGDDIFKLCKKVYNFDKYDYNIDGLILTPADLTVGSHYKNEKSLSNTFGGTWKMVFKWKPPEENSIDMLVVLKEIINIKNKGKHIVSQLYVSFRGSMDENVNPYDVLSDTYRENNSHSAKLFSTVYLPLVDSDTYPKTKNNEFIYNNQIIEFSYNTNEQEGFQWIPYRVRYDKTELYQKNNDIFGTANSYMTAINVMQSILNPVTLDMISGNTTLTKEMINIDDVYYSRKVNRNKILSKSMSSFHNTGIKSPLYKLFKNKNYDLVELASGKSGDMYKWIDSNFKNIVAFDVNLDNILNVQDGAYKRYWMWKNDTKMNKAINMIFIQKDVSKPWNEEDSIKNSQMKEMYEIVWGKTKKTKIQEPTMIKFYSMMNKQFDVVSCQFAIHYMFESISSIKIFCENVNKVIKQDGYFIGTCLDGQIVMNKLNKTEKGLIEGKIDDNTVWMIKRKYDITPSNNNVGVGKKISVYMESINKVYDEYLVDFEVLKEQFKEYGIHELSDKDKKYFGLKDSIGSFENWYIDTFNMHKSLQQYSFMNKWFIFKKYESK